MVQVLTSNMQPHMSLYKFINYMLEDAIEWALPEG